MQIYLRKRSDKVMQIGMFLLSPTLEQLNSINFMTYILRILFFCFCFFVSLIKSYYTQYKNRPVSYIQGRIKSAWACTYSDQWLSYLYVGSLIVTSAIQKRGGIVVTKSI